MKVQYCKNEHLFTNQRGMELCPTCGQPLTEGDLPDSCRKEGPEPDGSTLSVDVKTPLSLLVADVLATPAGQRLAFWCMKKISDKYF